MFNRGEIISVEEEFFEKVKAFYGVDINNLFEIIDFSPVIFLIKSIDSPGVEFHINEKNCFAANVKERTYIDSGVI